MANPAGQASIDKWLNTDFWQQSAPFGIASEKKQIVFGEYDSARKTFYQQWTSERVLGKGGFGSVFLCSGISKEGNSPIAAIKAVKVNNLREALDVAQKEVAGLIGLEHPSIVKVQSGFIPYQTEGSPKPMPLVCIRMEYIPGQNLQDVIDNRDIYPQIPLQEKLRWVMLLVDALDYLASKRIVHNDLKPANIMVTSDEGKTHLKIVDFGLARYAPSSAAVEGGTLPWLPPEHPYWGSSGLGFGARFSPSPKGDLWALGVIIFQIFATDNNWMREFISMANVLRHPTKPMQKLLEEKIPYESIRILLQMIFTEVGKRKEITEIKQLLKLLYAVFNNAEFEGGEFSSSTHPLELTSAAMLVECGGRIASRAIVFLDQWIQNDNAVTVIAKHVLPSLLKAIPDSRKQDLPPGIIEAPQGLDSHFLQFLSMGGIAGELFDILYKLIATSSPSTAMRVLNSEKLTTIISEFMPHMQSAALVIEGLVDKFACRRYLENRFSLSDRLVAPMMGASTSTIAFLTRLSDLSDPPIDLILHTAMKGCKYQSIVLRDILRYHRDVGAFVSAQPRVVAVFTEFLKKCSEESHPAQQTAYRLLYNLLISPLVQDAMLKFCAKSQRCSREFCDAIPIHQPLVVCRTCSQERGNVVRICLPCRNLCHRGHRFGSGPPGMILGKCSCTLASQRCSSMLGDEGQADLACRPEAEALAPLSNGLRSALDYSIQDSSDEMTVLPDSVLIPRPPKFTWSGAFNPLTGKISFPFDKGFNFFPILGVQLPARPQADARKILFYCEVLIDSFPAADFQCFSLGFSPHPIKSKPGAVGWEPGEVGYHSDDGALFVGSSPALCPSFGLQYGEGDIIGAGLFADGQPFFTHNGVFLIFPVSDEIFAKPNRNRPVFFSVSASVPATCTLRFLPNQWKLKNINPALPKMWPFPINNQALVVLQDQFQVGLSRVIASLGQIPEDKTDLKSSDPVLQAVWRLIARVLREKHLPDISAEFEMVFEEEGQADLDDETLRWLAEKDQLLQDLALNQLVFSEGCFFAKDIDSLPTAWSYIREIATLQSSAQSPAQISYRYETDSHPAGQTIYTGSSPQQDFLPQLGVLPLITGPLTSPPSFLGVSPFPVISSPAASSSPVPVPAPAPAPVPAPGPGPGPGPAPTPNFAELLQPSSSNMNSRDIAVMLAQQMVLLQQQVADLQRKTSEQ